MGRRREFSQLGENISLLVWIWNHPYPRIDKRQLVHRTQGGTKARKDEVGCRHAPIYPSLGELLNPSL